MCRADRAYCLLISISVLLPYAVWRCFDTMISMIFNWGRVIVYFLWLLSVIWTIWAISGIKPTWLAITLITLNLLGNILLSATIILDNDSKNDIL